MKLRAHESGWRGTPCQGQEPAGATSCPDREMGNTSSAPQPQELSLWATTQIQPHLTRVARTWKPQAGGNGETLPGAPKVEGVGVFYGD
jgi:hypothetical protein